MTSHDTTPSAEEKVVKDILKVFIVDTGGYYENVLREFLKSYKKEILEEVERKVIRKCIRKITDEISFGGKHGGDVKLEIIDLLNSLK